MFGKLVKVFFDEAGHNFQTSGVLLEFPSCSIRLWARVGGVVQDGGAHKAIWHSRGDGASMCCMRCLNLCTVASQVCDEDGTGLLVCNVIKASELVPNMCTHEYNEYPRNINHFDAEFQSEEIVQINVNHVKNIGNFEANQSTENRFKSTRTH